MASDGDGKKTGTKSAAPSRRSQGNGKSSLGTIVLTGASGFLGSNLLRRFEQDDSIENIVAIDLYKPPFPLKKARFYKLDLTEPTADEELARILQDEDADTFVHLAFLNNPTRQGSYAHELEAIGTMYVLNACEETRVRKFVMSSTTMVYGARPSNPNYLEEGSHLHGCPRSRFVRDKVGAEKQAADFARRNSDTVVTVLRPCAILGPTIQSFWSRFFARGIVPRILGFDPLWQFVHELDVIDAFKLVIHDDHPGAFNIVGEGVMPMSTILNISGKVALPLPSLALRAMLDGLWMGGQFEFPSSMLDYLRFLWVAEGKKARDVMGFHPKHSTRAALQSFLGMQRLRAVRLVD